MVKEVKLRDEYGNDIEATIMNQIKVAESNRLSGGVFNAINNGDAPDSNFWTVTNANGGTTTITNSEALITTTTTSNSSSILSGGKARYRSGASNALRCVFRFGPGGGPNNVRTVGIADSQTAPTTGVFAELSNSTFSVYSMIGNVKTYINNGSFNGDVCCYNPTNNYSTLEMYYTNKTKSIVIDGKTIHRFIANTSPTTSTLHLYPYASNVNTGVGPACTLGVTVMSISVFGKPTSQPRHYFQQGITSGVLLKTGPGSVHSLNVSAVSNNSVISIYDGVSTAGTLLYSTGTMSGLTQPVTIGLDSDGGLQFGTGLYLTIAGASSNCLIKYE